MNTSVPLLKDIVLLGGGHSHALVLRRWAMQPLVGVRLTLISQDVLTPYSGMLPGFIAGHYSSDDIHIDLARLCRWAGVRFIEATVTGLDLAQQRVQIDQRPDVAYDVLSIDTGSTPDTSQVPGAADFTIPVKPINQLQSRWRDFRDRLAQRNERVDIGVVGSGVGGFELTVALDHDLKARQQPHRMHWILRGQEPITSRPAKARQLALQACDEKGIQVHRGFDVCEVTRAGLHAVDNRHLALDEVFWCTAAAAATWPGAAGLKLDAKGFIATNAYLQSLSHAEVFAAGDVATQVDTPSEKAGVFAVRQAPVLFENLRRFVTGQPLKKYRPQKETLSLMALGEKRAIATRGQLTLSGAWVWRWKDSIDQAFMRKLKDLPTKKMPLQTPAMIPRSLREQHVVDIDLSNTGMRCGGCGAKVPADVLGRVMASLQTVQRDDVLVGIQPPGDAAVIAGDGRAMAQSVDQFRAMLDDPWVLGRVAALHALNDLFALSAEPQSALALVTLTHAADSLQERELFQLMSGALFELNRHGCALTGGHTGEGAELSLGFAVNGWLPRDSAKPVSRLRAGDSLILTKALGTGILLNADMHARASGTDVRHCIESMLLSNAAAVPIFSAHLSVMTDVTGFGLLGHLVNLLGTPVVADPLAGGLRCELQFDALPVLPGVVALAEQGVQSTLLPANLRYLEHTDKPDALSQYQRLVLCDPQTSGGLLAGVRADAATECIDRLHHAGYTDAAVIGSVVENPANATAQVQLQGLT